MTGESPSRNDSVTMMMTCVTCGRPFQPSGRRRHCSDACRVAAWRRRHTQPVAQTPLPPKGRRREVTVYQCDNVVEAGSGLVFADFFQNDPDTGRKGIVVINLEGLP